MVKLTADSVVQDGEHGVQIDCEMTGTGEQILNEVLNVIRSIMSNMKQEDPYLHMIAIKTIADEPSILIGEDIEPKKISFAKMMSDLTDKSVIN